MKKIDVLFFAVVFTALSVVATAQTRVYPIEEANAKAVKGATFTYMLPATTFKVTVTEIKVTDVEGYYSEYAESLLGLTNIVKKNGVSYLLDKVEVETSTIPDSKNAYFVECKTVAPLMDLFVDGGENAIPVEKRRVYKNKPAKLPDFFRNYADVSYTQQSNAFVDTKIIDGVVTQVPASHTKMVSKSKAQKAQQAADAIAKSRQDQYSIASGEQETPYSADAIKTMIDELKEWESNYLSLFTGVSLYDTIQTVIYVTPDGSQNDVPLFSFTNKNGISWSKSSKDAYSLGITAETDNNRIFTFENELNAQRDKSLMFRYRKPARMNVQLRKNGDDVYDFGCLEIYQYGNTRVFPVNERPAGVNKIGFIY